MISKSDNYYMQRALDLAIQALGRTSPNPLVGAVIVKDGQIIGEGFHQKAGTPHAEIHALRMAGDKAEGATAYVTLEPCSHYGRTPPCADALIKAKVKKVVIAVSDPNPLVAGRGIEKLNNAGIQTELGILEPQARQLNEVFFKYIQTGMPFAALKTAMTLDGKMATYTGDSKWITAQDSRLYVHHLRDIYDAIMVGIGTVIKDNPQLNSRLENETGHNPIRIVIDGNLDIPLDSNIVKSSREQRTIVFCSEQADKMKERHLTDMGVEVVSISAPVNKIPLERVLRHLAEINICSVLVEGGGEINGYMLENHLIDKLYWFIAPKIVGGHNAPSPVGGQGIRLMNEAAELASYEIQKFESDLLIIGYLK